MAYTFDPATQSCDPEALRQELVKALGPDGWHLNTAGNTVDFVQDDMSRELDPTAVIEAHFDGGAVRAANAGILEQIAVLEATVTPRRLREATLGIDNGWLKALNDKITALRSGLK